jgi:hypothetical protein
MPPQAALDPVGAALARVQRGEPTLVEFGVIDEQFKQLLAESARAAPPSRTTTQRRYTPRNTLNSRNRLTGKGVSSLHTMLIGRLPSVDSSVTRPHAR